MGTEKEGQGLGTVRCEAGGLTTWAILRALHPECSHAARARPGTFLQADNPWPSAQPAGRSQPASPSPAAVLSPAQWPSAFSAPAE